MQPAVSDTDLAVVWKSASDRPWETHYAHTPIFCLYYIDGSTQGQGYTDARVMSGARSIQGAAQVRAAFTVSGAKKRLRVYPSVYGRPGARGTWASR